MTQTSPLVRIRYVLGKRGNHQQARYKAPTSRPFKTPLYPSFPKSCLSAFFESQWWDGLNKIERPTSYNIARNRARNDKVDMASFVPQFGARTMGFKTGYHGAGPVSWSEYWVGLKPDGTYYILGLSCFDRDRAYASYIQKLAYWGRRPLKREDKLHLKTVLMPEGQDIFDVRLPISLETLVGREGGNSQERTSIGKVLGITDEIWRGRPKIESKPKPREPLKTFDEMAAEGFLDEAAWLLRKNWGVRSKRAFADPSQGVQKDPRLRPHDTRGGVNRKRGKKRGAHAG